MSTAIPGENATAHRLLECFARFRRLGAKQHAFEGITPSEMMLLATIGKLVADTGRGPKISEISDLLDVAKPTITQQLNSLESRSLIERQMDSGDRRVIRVTVAPAGHEIVRKAREAFFAAISGLVEHLGEDDSNRLADLLQKSFTYFQETHSATHHQTR